MICDFGDVVVVPFPFVDLPVVRRRPALVLSGRAFNEPHGQSILAMITTASRSAWPSDIVISDRESAGLRERSLIRFKLFTLPNELIVRRLGAIARTDRAAATRSVRAIFLPARDAPKK